ncbi:MAG: hypothetical protein VB674_08565, partial [Vicinamibacterales bacterium]
MTKLMMTQTMTRLSLASGIAALVLWLVPAVIEVDAAANNNGVIRGTVTSTNGPEAGVWVIAETDDLETIYRKIVVTDDDGQYVLPELP